MDAAFWAGVDSLVSDSCGEGNDVRTRPPARFRGRYDAGLYLLPKFFYLKNLFVATNVEVATQFIMNL